MTTQTVVGASVTKPMLAVECEEAKLIFPLIAQPKIDGIRALTQGKLLSRTFEEIPNKHIRETLKGLPDGLDGELVVGEGGGNFQATSSLVMSEDKIGEFRYIVFDYMINPTDTFADRFRDLYLLDINWPSQVEICESRKINSLEELHKYEQEMLDLGYEGLILRRIDAKYKCGRSTVKGGELLKLKRFSDSEGKIIGFYELEHNGNEAEKDNFGRTKRSSKKANMVPMGTLGGLIVQWKDEELRIGSGFTMEQRQDVWNNQEAYLGKLAKFKYFEKGMKTKPRHPIYLGIRDEKDI